MWAGHVGANLADFSSEDCSPDIIVGESTDCYGTVP
jgi:hypothetical protein